MPHALLQRSLPFVLALVLSACASTDHQRVAEATTTPLNDLNLVHADIPPILLEAQKQAYAQPADASCATLTAEISQLDMALGADLDTPSSESNPGLIERGTDQAKDTAVGALRRTMEGVVPFRGWVRKLSGAERYSKKVSAAIAAGTVRRAFLKGVRVAQPVVLNSAAN